MITTIAVALITAVLGPVVVAWAKSKMEPVKKGSPLGEAIALNTVVDEQLAAIREELGADRVWVSQFHNGGHFYPTSKSIQKFSIFYEQTSIGTAASQMVFQNIPCSLFPRSMSEIMKEGEISVPSLSSENYGLGQFAEQYGTKSFYMVALKDLQGRFIGTLSVAYNTEYKFTKDDWIYIRQKAGVVGTLLDEYLNI